jgi:hypothetical protein
MPHSSGPQQPTLLEAVELMLNWLANLEFNLRNGKTCDKLKVPSGLVKTLLAAFPGAADYIVEELVEVADQKGVVRSAYVSGHETLYGGDEDDGVSFHKWHIRQVLECARRDDKSGKSASGGDDGERSDKDDDSGEDDSSEDKDEGDYDDEDDEDDEDEAFELKREVARRVAAKVRSGNVELRTHECMCAHCTRTRLPDGGSVSGGGDGGGSSGSSGSSDSGSSSRSVVKGFCHGAVCGCLRATVNVTLPGHCQPTRLTFATKLYHTAWPSPKRVQYVRVNDMLRDAFHEDPDAFYLVAHPHYRHFCRAQEFAYYPADIVWPHLEHHSKHLMHVLVSRARKERDQEQAERCQLQEQLAETKKQLAETQKQLALARALAPAPAPALAAPFASVQAKRKHGSDMAARDMPAGKQVCVEPASI